MEGLGDKEGREKASSKILPSSFVTFLLCTTSAAAAAEVAPAILFTTSISEAAGATPFAPSKSWGEARGKLGGSWGKHATFWGSTPLGVSNSLEKKGKQLVRAAFLYISVIKVYSVLKDLGVCSGHLQTRPKGV